MTKNEINKGVVSGTKKLQDSVSDLTLINQLKTNAGVFSAFKNHHQTNAIVSLLTNEKGDIVPFNEFKKEALKISNKYNKNWLTTEYNTATRRAITAANFKRYKDDSDLYPNLKWTPSRSAEPRQSHIPFYGIVKPIEDPFWTENFPGNDWNCKCGVEQSNEKVTKNVPKSNMKVPAGLDGNPAFTGDIISKSHPYYKGVNKTETANILKVVKSDINFDMRKWSQKNIPIKGKTITNEILQTGTVILTRGNLKSMVTKSVDPFFKTYCTVLEKDIDNWKYIGYKKVIEGKHGKVDYFTYYKTSYDKTEIYVIVKVIDGAEYPYSLSTIIKGIIKKKLPK